MESSSDDDGDQTKKARRPLLRLFVSFRSAYTTRAFGIRPRRRRRRARPVRFGAPHSASDTARAAVACPQQAMACCAAGGTKVRHAPLAVAGMPAWGVPEQRTTCIPTELAKAETTTRSRRAFPSRPPPPPARRARQTEEGPRSARHCARERRPGHCWRAASEEEGAAPAEPAGAAALQRPDASAQKTGGAWMVGGCAWPPPPRWLLAALLPLPARDKSPRASLCRSPAPARTTTTTQAARLLVGYCRRPPLSAGSMVQEGSLLFTRARTAPRGCRRGAALSCT